MDLLGGSNALNNRRRELSTVPTRQPPEKKKKPQQPPGVIGKGSIDWVMTPKEDSNWYHVLNSRKKENNYREAEPNPGTTLRNRKRIWLVVQER